MVYGGTLVREGYWLGREMGLGMQMGWRGRRVGEGEG